MRVFVTGASGHIGSAVVPELIRAGHRVVGLARSDASADTLALAGADVHRGDLDDLDGLAAAGAAADGVIHLAFKHEIAFTGDYLAAAASDRRAIEAIGAALAGSGKPFVSTGGTLTLGAAGVAGRPANEHDRLGEGPRVDAENAVIAMAETGVRSSVVRLSPLVHSSLDHHGFAPILIRVAREKGISGYVGEGSNRWPAVHTLDAARLYRLALESATAGSILHGVADEGVPFREIAESIARKLSVPSVSVAPGDAFEHFGFLGAFAAVDNPVSSALTREWLNWKPAHAGLIADLEEDHYFAAVAA